jgi:NADH-quinone oxidoreductase subunit J
VTIGPLLFYLLACGAVVSALGMVTARNVVHAVMFMVVNFSLTGLLYLALHAPFIAVVQVAVYAGAIMVLFLFVVMILGDAEASLGEPIRGQRGVGLVLIAVLGVLLVLASAKGVPAVAVRGAAVVPAAFGSPAAVGAALFRDHLLPFEVVGVLLLVAMVGVIVIAGRGGGPGKDVDGGGEG